MIEPGTKFPGQSNGASAQYPQGSAKNDVVPGDQGGTPWVADLINDTFGFHQALLASAGVSPSGDPDTVLASDMLDAVKLIILNVAHPVGSYYMTSDSGDPNALLGGGTWDKQEGRFVVGHKAGDPDFGNLSDTGGSTTHGHGHTLANNSTNIDHTHTTGIDGWGSLQVGGKLPEPTTDGRLITGSGFVEGAENLESLAHATTAVTTSSSGGSHSHSVTGAVTDGKAIPPYVVAAVWRRTA